MSQDAELMKLYSQQILALAAEIPHTKRLTDPDQTVKRRSPVCGSSVTVDIRLEDGKVAEFGQDVKACALGQAAAAIVGGAVIGKGLTDLQAGRDQLTAMLKTSGPIPEPPFDGFEVLSPARNFKNRHASILLCIEAVTEAVQNLDVTS